MAFLIFGIIIGVVIGIVEGWDFIEKIGLSLLYSFLGLLAGICIFLVAGLFIGLGMPKTETVETKEIYALNDASNLEGHFYLASGYVKENEVIKYISDGEYGKKIYTAKVDESYINEGYDNAYVEIHKKELKYNWMYLFAYHFQDDTYIFFVPDGSVTNEINIDLE